MPKTTYIVKRGTPSQEHLDKPPTAERVDESLEVPDFWAAYNFLKGKAADAGFLEGFDPIDGTRVYLPCGTMWWAVPWSALAEGGPALEAARREAWIFGYSLP